VRVSRLLNRAAPQQPVCEVQGVPVPGSEVLVPNQGVAEPIAGEAEIIVKSPLISKSVVSLEE
jgi:hypothetical protein